MRRAHPRNGVTGAAAAEIWLRVRCSLRVGGGGGRGAGGGLAEGGFAPTMSFLSSATVSVGAHCRRSMGPVTSLRLPRWNRVRCACSDVSDGSSRTFTMMTSAAAMILGSCGDE